MFSLVLGGCRAALFLAGWVCTRGGSRGAAGGSFPNMHPREEHRRSGAAGRGCRHSGSRGHVFPAGACGRVCCRVRVSGFARAVPAVTVSLQCRVLEGSRGAYQCQEAKSMCWKGTGCSSLTDFPSLSWGRWWGGLPASVSLPATGEEHYLRTAAARWQWSVLPHLNCCL